MSNTELLHQGSTLQTMRAIVLSQPDEQIRLQDVEVDIPELSLIHI